jgi:hypothetical protein
MYSREWMAKLRRKARKKAEKHAAARAAKELQAKTLRKKNKTLGSAA